MTPEIRQELDRLLAALCDGELSDVEQSRLEGLLEADLECRLRYLEYLDLHAGLLIHPGGHQAAPTPPATDPGGATVDLSREARTLPLPPAARRPAGPSRGRRGGRYALVAAATLAASLLVQVYWWQSHPPGGEGLPPPANDPGGPAPPGPIATLTGQADCTWEGVARPWPTGARLRAGEMRLRQGVAEVRFDGGATLVFEGPAEFRLDADTAATLGRGKVVFRGGAAVPFDLSTPSATLVDVGTEYAVTVGPDGEEVHVFEGEVRRTARSGGGPPERLVAGEARRYGRAADDPGRPTGLDTDRFVRRPAGPDGPPPDPAAGLLAYEGFGYDDAAAFRAGHANGGTGWAGPWAAAPVWSPNRADRHRLVLNPGKGLDRPGAPTAAGGFETAGQVKYYRRLAAPVRLDADGAYYLSFLFRQGQPTDAANALAVVLRTSDEPPGGQDPWRRLAVGVGGPNQLFTHIERACTHTPLPLSYGRTYLLVARLTASRSGPDQVCVRVYGPEEAVDREEPALWQVAGPGFHSDLVFDCLEIHVNSKSRQAVDEIRLGTTWSSVTAPWAGGR